MRPKFLICPCGAACPHGEVVTVVVVELLDWDLGESTLVRHIRGWLEKNMGHGSDILIPRTVGVKVSVIRVLTLGCSIFPVTFRINTMALVRCPCAFRLRRLARSLRRRFCLLLACGPVPVNFRKKWLMCDWTGWHKTGVALLGRGIFPENSRVKWLL